MAAKLTALQEIQIKLMRHYGPRGGDPGAKGLLSYKYMSLDPGEGTGWALWSETGHLTDFGNVYDDVNGVADLFEELTGRGTLPDVIIYEKWKLLKTKEFYGSTMLSCQVVGVIRAFGHLIEAELISQETNIKSIAQSWTGLKPVGAHATQHFVDAINHGWYYLQMNKKITPRLNWNEPGGM